MNALKDIWDENYVHPNINSIDDRLKILDRIRQTQSEWKGSELSAKRMKKVLHKIFKAVVKKIK